MSQLRLRVSICYRLLSVAKRTVALYFANSFWMNVQERGDVLQVKNLHDTRTALQQHLVVFTGRSTMEVKIVRTELAENVLANHGT